MYLSCLTIDAGESGSDRTIGSRWLQNRYRVHQRLCMAFPRESRLIADPDFLAPLVPEDFPLLRPEASLSIAMVGVQRLTHVHAARSSDAGFLFRIDSRCHSSQIIVQSATAPNWLYAFANFRGVLLEEPKVRPFAPAFSRGQRVQFRLEANPTRCIDSKSAPDGTRRRGRRVPVPAAGCVEWLRRFGLTSGFSLHPQDVSLDFGPVRVRKGADAQGGITYFAARFDGLITIDDPEAFVKKLSSGFGAAKSYGFGLMSVTAPQA